MKFPALSLILVLCLQNRVSASWWRYRGKNGISLQEMRQFELRAEDKHPLDPLSPSEITATRDIINSAKGTGFIYNILQLREPLKSELVTYFLEDTTPPAGSISRRAFAIVIERSSRKVYEAVVNLDSKQVESFTFIDNVQPPGTVEEQMMIGSIASSDPEVIKRCAGLGWSNMSLVFPEPWLIGYYADVPEWQGKRVVQVYFYGRNFDGDNLYAHPFDFLVVVDLGAQSVIAVQDLPTHNDFDASNKVGNNVPRKEGNYDYRLRGGDKFLRKDDKPIKMSSPEGPSFIVKGYQVEWQKWKMRVGFNSREGVTLHTISYNDSGKVRPIMYRGSVVEMFAPYGDPRPPYHRKMPYDMGKVGMGLCADTLKAGEDFLGAYKLFDAFLCNSTGDPVPYLSSFSIREEDHGFLWKHVDYRTGKGLVVRSHRLVVSFIATVFNYEYMFSWAFYQDGSIQMSSELTGIVSLNLLAQGATPAGHGTMMSPQLNAMYHQHMFAARLDLDLDGTSNTVHTVDAVGLPDGPGNPYKQGFTSKLTTLSTPTLARTKIDPSSARSWLITNDGKIHPAAGRPVGWKLHPMNTQPMVMRDDSPIRRQAGLFSYDVWVTKFAEGQVFPAGDYVYVNDSGLPAWVAGDKDGNIENTDIVLWHTYSLNHIPRVEDYPVMPVESTGFWLKPSNFFMENPGIDVPPPKMTGTQWV